VSAEPELRLHRICVSASAIAEVVGNVRLVSIPRSDVRRLYLRRGVVAERPLILTVFGLAATAVGVFAALYLWGVASGDRHGVVMLKLPAVGLTMLGFGPAMIVAAFRRGAVLRVETARETRKLGFGARVGREELARFVDALRSSGLDVEVGADLLPG
jgi:hypothetical protein